MSKNKAKSKRNKALARKGYTMELSELEIRLLKSSKDWVSGEVYIPNIPQPIPEYRHLKELGLIEGRLRKLAPMAHPVTLYFITQKGTETLEQDTRRTD